MRQICVDHLKLPVGDPLRGPRLQYSPGDHGAFLLDPDGHNVEAVWHAPVGDEATFE